MLGGGPGAIRKLDQRESWGARLGLHLTSFPLTPAFSFCFLRFFAGHPLLPFFPPQTPNLRGLFYILSSPSFPMHSGCLAPTCSLTLWTK